MHLTNHDLLLDRALGSSFSSSKRFPAWQQRKVMNLKHKADK